LAIEAMLGAISGRLLSSQLMTADQVGSLY
jgi:hypothetical protein